MDQYNLDNLVSELSGKDFIELVVYLNKKATHLEKIKIDRKSHEYDRYSAYKKHVDGFGYFINTGGVPHNIDIEGLKLFLPIIKYLVSKGQLKKEVLELF